MRLSDKQIADIKEYLARSIKITASSLIPRLSRYGLDLIETIEALQQENEQLQEFAKAKADGRLVERGTWINGYCSNCNSPIPTDNKDDYIAKNECRFCYYCGAKMEEAAEKALEAKQRGGKRDE